MPPIGKELRESVGDLCASRIERGQWLRCTACCCNPIENADRARAEDDHSI